MYIYINTYTLPEVFGKFFYKEDFPANHIYRSVFPITNNDSPWLAQFSVDLSPPYLDRSPSL